jgi:colanic acid biosynthesis glycosyl transferase WcaI
VPPDPRLCQELGLEGRFVVGFFGNHGIAQDLEGVLDAAALMRSEDRFRFLLVGEGPIKAALLAKQASLGLDNVLFLPQVPQHAVVRYIALCDAVLVPLRKMELLRGFIPSKLFDFMACARPILLQVDGEAREVLDEARAGLFAEPGDSASLADAVRRMASMDAAAREQFGSSGLAYVLRHRLREQQAQRLHETLLSLDTAGPYGVSASFRSPSP